MLRFQESKFALSVTRTEPDLNASRRLEEAAAAVRLTGGGGQGKEGWANFEELVLGCVGTDLCNSIFIRPHFRTLQDHPYATGIPEFLNVF